MPKISDSHSYQTRHGALFRTPKHKTKLYENCPMFAGIRLFNSLPVSIKNECGHRSFKNKLKNLLCEKAYYTVREYLTDNFCC